MSDLVYHSTCSIVCSLTVMAMVALNLGVKQTKTLTFTLNYRSPGGVSFIVQVDFGTGYQTTLKHVELSPPSKNMLRNESVITSQKHRNPLS